MMFGIDVEDIKLQPKEIGDDVFIPVHVEQGEMATTHYMKYEDYMEQLDDEESGRVGTDDYRFDT